MDELWCKNWLPRLTFWTALKCFSKRLDTVYNHINLKWTSFIVSLMQFSYKISLPDFYFLILNVDGKILLFEKMNLGFWHFRIYGVTYFRMGQKISLLIESTLKFLYFFKAVLPCSRLLEEIAGKKLYLDFNKFSKTKWFISLLNLILGLK